MHQLILTSVSGSHSTGPDRISPSTIKLLSHSLSPILTKIFNTCLDLCVFPLVWKQTIIKPLSKVSLPRSSKDTRPIANLSELSKLFEKVIHVQIATYLDENQLRDPLQSGYRKHYSTQTALLKLCHDVRLSADKRKVTILVLFDFSKAFDIVHHSILLNKLSEIGFSESALKFMYAYLTNRSQCVVDSVSNQRSKSVKINMGVPQRSVIGPLLFTLFVNDISSRLTHSKHIIFADDLQIYKDCLPSQLNDAITEIEHDITSIADYAKSNRLKLNLDKTKILILGSSVYINAIDIQKLSTICIGCNEVPYVKQARALGVLLQSNLSWSKHVSFISSRVHASLYRLKHQKTYCLFHCVPSLCHH